jgi:hypothetical protein
MVAAVFVDFVVVSLREQEEEGEESVSLLLPPVVLVAVVFESTTMMQQYLHRQKQLLGFLADHRWRQTNGKNHPMMSMAFFFPLQFFTE